MLRGNAIMWHKSAFPATESHSVQPRSGLVASPDPCGVHEVLGDGCSPDASRAGMLTLCAKQRLATARVTNLIRNAIVALVGWLPRWLVTTASEHVASPTLTWLTGPTKQLSRSRPSLHVDTKHWIRPTASNLVKFGPAD